MRRRPDHALELTAPAEVAAGTEERLRRVDVARLPRRLQREKHFLDACEEGTSVEGRIGGAEFGETFFGAQHLRAVERTAGAAPKCGSLDCGHGPIEPAGADDVAAVIAGAVFRETERSAATGAFLRDDASRENGLQTGCAREVPKLAEAQVVAVVGNQRGAGENLAAFHGVDVDRQRVARSIVLRAHQPQTAYVETFEQHALPGGVQRGDFARPAVKKRGRKVRASRCRVPLFERALH